MMSHLNQAWIAWRALFAGVPYGDPYVAVAVLMVVVAVVVRVGLGRTDH